MKIKVEGRKYIKNRMENKDVYNIRTLSNDKEVINRKFIQFCTLILQ